MSKISEFGFSINLLFQKLNKYSTKVTRTPKFVVWILIRGGDDSRVVVRFFLPQVLCQYISKKQYVHLLTFPHLSHLVAYQMTVYLLACHQEFVEQTYSLMSNMGVMIAWQHLSIDQLQTHFSCRFQLFLCELYMTVSPLITNLTSNTTDTAQGVAKLSISWSGDKVFQWIMRDIRCPQMSTKGQKQRYLLTSPKLALTAPHLLDPIQHRTH